MSADVQVINVDSGEETSNCAVGGTRGDLIDDIDCTSEVQGDNYDVLISVEEVFDTVAEDMAATGRNFDIHAFIEEAVSTETFDKDVYDLVGVMAYSANEAYDIYNDYAFKVGFSVRKSKQRLRADYSLSMKRYLCSHAGLKKQNGNPDKSFSKLDVRTNCPALVQFDIGKEGTWVISKHVKEHNHPLCHAASSHLLRSHRRILKNQVCYLQELQKSGVGIADGVRVLKNQSGDSPFLGVGLRDAYNALNNAKVLEGTDCNKLIQSFKSRQANEKDFFFDFEIDSQSRLCSFFWRDGRMRQDYDLFGDLVVHDTTYRTNKYDMICGPFVGMNHHGMNIMFGCGFLLNEKIESFEWLFSSFLRSMGGKHPATIMTDQSAAMDAAISKIFPCTRHRLCIWHICENSKKHIKSLRCQKGFMDLFYYVLKYCYTIAEFEHYWERMNSAYGCANNKWLVKLYRIREKWCLAFSKDYFSGGILSSQRSESTNQAISEKLSKTAGLCDFYNGFVKVISEWRSKENRQDVRCLVGKRLLALMEARLLLHAREIYTLKLFELFEEQYLKGAQYHQSVVSVESTSMRYHVWEEDVDRIKHNVCFGLNDQSVSSTCKMFYEVGILCSHCLRILNIHCVSVIPDMYILKRWRKDVINGRELEDDVPSLNSPYKHSMAASLWRIQMVRQFHKMISPSEDNKDARLMCEDGFESIRQGVVSKVGPIFFDECSVDTSSSNACVQNPKSNSLKYQRNRRAKSTTEKIYDQAGGRRKRAKTIELQTKIVVQNVVDDGYVVHPVCETGML